ncbi:MAG: tetratricopeptide repeat protein, partial [Ktedonobacteraceae bacterium]|nr:tetratricopeptide repeat protein [Ktedonobacteraceae bacterium]
EMMNTEQRHRFRTLGIFAPETPITWEAVQVIWNLEEQEDAQEALNELENLALLTKDTDDTDAPNPIYRLHGLLQVYAHALLETADEFNRASWTHARYYTTMVWQAEQATPKNYPLLDQHIQNLLAALKWTVDNEPDLFTELLDGLGQFFLLRGQSQVLERYLPEAVEAARALGRDWRLANLLTSLGDLENRLGNIDLARTHYDAALPLFQAERDQLGEASVYMSFGDMFIAQWNWIQAKTYYERALPLFVIERDPLGQANTLIDLGRVRFELGDSDQGIQNVQQAATFFRENRQDEWVQRADLSALEMSVRMLPQAASIDVSVPDKELLRIFGATASAQDMLELVKQYPQLLLISYEELSAAQDNENTKHHLDESVEMLAALKDDVLQQSLAAQVLIDFAQADWETRRMMLAEQATVLLGEAIEPLVDLFAQAYTQPDTGTTHAWESLRTLLHHCRIWGSEPILYFEEYMRMGDDIDIPTAYESKVMQIATLLSHQEDDIHQLEQAIETMQTLLDQLTNGEPQLFEAALLHDLAQAVDALPGDHPKRKKGLILDYCREALSLYHVEERPLPVAFIQRIQGNILIEEGRYQEALEPLATASQTLLAQEEYQISAIALLSSYAFALDKLAQTDEALEVYNQLIERLPDVSSLLYARAETLIHARQLDKAEADLQRAVELDGNEDDPDLWLRRTQIAIARGSGSLAEQMLDELHKRSTSFNLTLLHAQSVWLRGDTNRAREALQVAFNEANEGEQAAMRREMQQLFVEHPDLPALNLPD